MNTSVVKRLAFIKYFFELGIAQSRLPEPANSASILMFHDSVELFLQLASETLDVGKSGVKFMEYWELLATKLPSGSLPQKESMRRLNDSRVGLKHHGTLPSKMDIESFRATTNEFFEEAIPLIFNIKLTEISLIDFIGEERAKEHLHDAAKQLTDGNLKSAMGKTALAFQYLIEDYESRKRSQYGRSPFSFGENFAYLDRWSMGLGHGSRPMLARDDFTQKLGDFIEKVTESMESMQGAIRILAMGIDYPKYSRFILITPRVYQTMDNKYHLTDTSDYNASKEDVQFCIDFVIETALRLQEFDYTLKGA